MLKYCLIKGRSYIENEDYNRKKEFLNAWCKLNYNELSNMEEIKKVLEGKKESLSLCSEVYLKLYMYYKVSSWIDEEDKIKCDIFEFLIKCVNRDINKEKEIKSVKSVTKNDKKVDISEKNCIIPYNDNDVKKKNKKVVAKNVAKCYTMHKERSEKENIKNINVDFNKLKKYFDELEMTNEQIADVLSISKRSYYRKISGEYDFTVKELLKIVMIFNLNLKDYIK